MRHKLLTFSHVRLAYAAVAVGAFALTETGRYVYRPYVYRSGFHDPGVADTMGNHLGTVALIYFILAVAHATVQEAAIVIAVVVSGVIGYEFVQALLPGSTFDSQDVVATIFGGLLTVGVYLLIRRSCLFDRRA